jgi:chromosome segregation ATPase
MAWKFLSIAKANARIDELEAQAATITTERDEARKALETNGAEISAQGEQAQKDLAAANTKLTQVEADLVTAKASVASQASEIKALKDTLAGKDAEVQAAVARKLAEEQAKLGQSGKPTPPAVGAAAAKEPFGADRVIAAARADLAAAGYVPKR